VCKQVSLSRSYLNHLVFCVAINCKYVRMSSAGDTHLLSLLSEVRKTHGPDMLLICTVIRLLLSKSVAHVTAADATREVWGSPP
jgi:hypothetical protein